MAYLMGIDVGTSCVKVILAQDSGKIVVSTNIEYPLLQPREGWAEQDPQQWWLATVSAIKKILSTSGIDGNEIKAIGLSGQMHGAVLLDENYQVLRPAILWCDQRTGAECDWINEMIGAEKLVAWTGNHALPGFTAPKLLWLRKHEPEIYSRVRHVLLPKDYIRYCLTGELATEVSDASGTLLLDVSKRDWSKQMLSALELSEDWFPRVVESAVISGQVCKSAALATSLREGTPVAGGGGDQAAGAVGSGIVEEGLFSVALGTSGVVFAATNQLTVNSDSSLHAFCHAVPDKWHLMGVMLSAGASLQWFRNKLAPGDSYDVLTEKAAEVKPGGEGLLFLPYLMGERTPYPDPSARGAFIGLNLRHHKGHLARAVLEGVSFGLRDSLELIRSSGITAQEVRVSGGGAQSSLWRQILADVFNIPVTVVNSSEGPAFGALLLAGTGVGIYSSVEEACRTTIKVVNKCEPIASNVTVYEQMYDIYNSLYLRLRDTMHGLTELANCP
ncbi:D-xylulose kinase [Desulfosporosinus acidiphilus SJ4]|uniref:Xylulose kinase n=1 Tax=Desulfosporosinus acidiphilus (strain DSM 22704 / JCM 16185 / SJ4) TaxID=646529 RepID=I4D2Q3_DESAJ|nr:xylulokinase [Desulfosporosinus acidiphilus]AFM40077.1 D-xylulose kinase [Desulfosporosinus acidiphilus SJ4]